MPSWITVPQAGRSHLLRSENPDSCVARSVLGEMIFSPNFLYEELVWNDGNERCPLDSWNLPVVSELAPKISLIRPDMAVFDKDPKKNGKGRLTIFSFLFSGPKNLEKKRS